MLTNFKQQTEIQTNLDFLKKKLLNIWITFGKIKYLKFGLVWFPDRHLL